MLTLPIAVKTIAILRAHYQEPASLAPANLGMICVHNFTAILLILAYFVTGFRPEAPVASLMPLGVLVILYIPIARLLQKAWRSPEEGSALGDDSDMKGGDVMTQQEFYLLEFTGSE